MLARYAVAVSSCLLLAVASSPANLWATSLVASDPSQVVPFVAGALGPFGFDDVPGDSSSPGALVDPANAYDDELKSMGVLISSIAGPAVAVNSPSDARSDPNLLAGTSLDGMSQAVVDYLQPLRFDFVVPGTSTPSTVSLVGFWNDPTGSIVRLDVFDASAVLIESAEGDEGQFIGIQASGIGAATVTHVSNQSVTGFTVDDLYVGGGVTTSTTTTTTTTTSTTTTSSTSTTSSSSTTTSSSTSTVAATTSTTSSTTTTLPAGDCSGVPDGPTIASIRCRLDALSARVTSEGGLGDFQPKLLQTLGKATERTGAANGFCADANTRKTRQRLKQVIRALTQYAHRLSTRAAHNKLDAALREELRGLGDGIKPDVIALRSSMRCPEDAAAP